MTAVRPGPAVGMICTEPTHTSVLAEALWEAAERADGGRRLDEQVAAAQGAARVALTPRDDER